MDPQDLNIPVQFSQHDVTLTNGVKLRLVYCDDSEDPKIGLSVVQDDTEIMMPLSEVDFMVVKHLLKSIPEDLL